MTDWEGKEIGEPGKGKGKMGTHYQTDEQQTNQDQYAYIVVLEVIRYLGHVKKCNVM